MLAGTSPVEKDYVLSAEKGMFIRVNDVKVGGNVPTKADVCTEDRFHHPAMAQGVNQRGYSGYSEKKSKCVIAQYCRKKYS